MSLINVTNLTFAYDGSYENIFENVNFQIDTNWKLGFTGRNGRGKTTFLNLLLGKYEYRGSITASVSFSYFPYHVEDPSNTIQQVLCLCCFSICCLLGKCHLLEGITCSIHGAAENLLT